MNDTLDISGTEYPSGQRGRKANGAAGIPRLSTPSGDVLYDARDLTDALNGKWYDSNDKPYGMVRCPAHDDQEPSLRIRDGIDGRVWTDCFAGCSREKVMAAIEKKLGGEFYDTMPIDQDRRAAMRKATKPIKKKRKRVRISEKLDLTRWHYAKPATVDHWYFSAFDRMYSEVREEGNGTLLVPYCDASGAIVGVEIVPPGGLKSKKSPDDSGRFPAKKKPVIAGSKKHGAIHGTTGGATDQIALAEGVRTAWAVRAATGCKAYSAGGMGLTAAARTVRKLHPDAEIFGYADQYPLDVAEQAMSEAMRAVSGKLVTPGFKRPSKVRNDFHDLLRMKNGADSIRKRLNKAEATEPTVKADKPRAELQTVCFADIQPEVLRWLFHPYIPLGKLTMIVGDPGVSKSLLSTDIAARVSRGRRWPVSRERAPRGSVLILSAEDDPADTIRPRLDAAGADVRRVHLLKMIKEQDGSEHLFSLERDLPILEGLLGQLGDVRLVVIDPISAYLGSTDSHRNSDVRGLLAPLTALAQRTQVAVLCISHLNKGSGSAMYRTTGSLAFVAAGRSHLAVGKDPLDQSRRLLLPVKANLSPDQDQRGIAYRIDTCTTKSRHDAPVIKWEREFVDGDVEEMLAPVSQKARSQLDDAMHWLTEELSNGPIDADKVGTLAGDAGHAWRTVVRAKKALCIKSHRTGKDGAWQWWPPNDPKAKSATVAPRGNLGTLGNLANNNSAKKFLEVKNAKSAKISKGRERGTLRVRPRQ